MSSLKLKKATHHLDISKTFVQGWVYFFSFFSKIAKKYAQSLYYFEFFAFFSCSRKFFNKSVIKMKKLLFVALVFGVLACSKSVEKAPDSQEDLTQNASKESSKKLADNAYTPQNSVQDQDLSGLDVLLGEGQNGANSTSNSSNQTSNTSEQFGAAQAMLQNLLTKHQPTKVVAKIDPNYNQAVIGKNGITGVFPAHCFDTSDSVTIEMVEYAKPSEFLLGGLGTMSGKERLQTGGTVHIAASVNGEPIQPKENYLLAFKKGEKEEDGMQIFNGQANADRSIDWNLDVFSEEILQKNIIEISEEIGEIITSQEANWGTQAYLSELYDLDGNTNLMADFRKKNQFMETSEKVFFDIFGGLIGGVAKYGLDKIEVVSDKDGNFEAVYSFKEGKLKNSNICQMLDRHLKKFYQKGKGIRPLSQMVFKIQDKPPYPIKEIVDITKIVRKRFLESYTFSVKIRGTGFGWINCDKFVERQIVNGKEIKKMNFVVDVPSNLKAATVQLYFPSLKSFMPMQRNNDNSWIAMRIPENEQVKVVVFALDQNEKMLMVTQNARIEQAKASISNMEDFSKEKLSKDLDPNKKAKI